ncbi:MAG: response regulator [bacterium]
MSAPRPAACIYVVEDDPKISAVIADYLRDTGHEVRTFRDGGRALGAMEEEPPDLVILDWMLPGMEGPAVCRQLRRFCTAPVLMLTARAEEADKVAGLEAGADDYVCKPFGARELMARVAALLRRSGGRVGTDPAVAPYAVDASGRRIAWRGRWLPLSVSEYQILAALMRRPGWVFTRDTLLDQLGAEFRGVSDRSIDSHIKNLRRKIARVDPQAQCIVSVYGVGYRFEV